MDTGTLVQACERIFGIYSRRSFKVTDMVMDMQFEPICAQLQCREVTLNTASAKEHVAEIERFIRVIKERTRALRSHLPYKKLPKHLLIAIIRHVCRWLNVFPPKNSISTISPRTLITGVKLDYNKHCRIEVGAYAQVHEEPDPSNRTDLYRTTGAIALESNDNLQGGCKFLSLNTGKVLDRRNFTELPITTDVIKRVEELAAKENSEINFYDRNNNLIEDFDDSELTGVKDDTERETNSDSDSEYEPDDDFSVQSNEVNDNNSNNNSEVEIIEDDNGLEQDSVISVQETDSTNSDPDPDEESFKFRIENNR